MSSKENRFSVRLTYQEQRELDKVLEKQQRGKTDYLRFCIKRDLKGK